MEEQIITSDAMQDSEEVKGIEFDDSGEMRFTNAGLAGLKNLLQTDPEQKEEVVEEEQVEETKPTEEEVKPEEKPKRKLKVDGQEIEVTEDELISLAQQGKDYTKKTQQLAEERNLLSPYAGLIKQLQSDPNLSQHIANYWQKSQEVQTPEFTDPIEQLKWEIKQEVIKETQAHIEKEVTPLHRQQALNEVKAKVQSDPDYAVVHQTIIDMVANQPPALQRNMYLQLDQDPASYLEAFDHFKKQINTKTETTKPIIPAPMKKTERAPILEGSNPALSEDVLKGQRAKLDKVKAKVLREGSVDALQDFLVTGGFLDHLK